MDKPALMKQIEQMRDNTLASCTDILDSIEAIHGKAAREKAALCADCFRHEYTTFAWLCRYAPPMLSSLAEPMFAEHLGMLTTEFIASIPIADSAKLEIAKMVREMNDRFAKLLGDALKLQASGG